MEGTQGITIESGVTPIPIAPTNVEAESTAIVEQSSTKKAEEQVESKSLEEKSADKLKKEKTKQAENNDEAREESSQNDEKEVDPLMEKREELETLLDMMGDKIDEKMKKKIVNDYIDGLLGGNEKEEQKVKMVESLAEFARLIKLIFALLMLAIFNPKPTYSGKDLSLSNTAPEDEKNEKISEAIAGKSGQKSWESFKEEVEMIEELPFDKFMNRVLAANAKHSITMYKPKKEENGNNILQKGGKKLGKFGKKMRMMKPAATRR